MIPPTTVAAFAALLALGMPQHARADGSGVFAGGPNRALLRSGIVTTGVPYVASAVVALTSEHAGDKNLFIPVAGAWLDFANRGSCGDPRETSCDRETVYKALLVVDGFVQAIGALEMIAAFVYPEARTITVAQAGGASWTVLPTRLASQGYGFAAFTRF